MTASPNPSTDQKGALFASVLKSPERFVLALLPWSLSEVQEEDYISS